MIRTSFYLSACLFLWAQVVCADRKPFAAHAQLDLRTNGVVTLDWTLSTEWADRIVPDNRQDPAFMTGEEFGIFEERLATYLRNHIVLMDVDVTPDVAVNFLKADDMSTPDFMLVERGTFALRMAWDLPETEIPGGLRWGVFSEEEREALVTLVRDEHTRPLKRLSPDAATLDFLGETFEPPTRPSRPHLWILFIGLIVVGVYLRGTGRRWPSALCALGVLFTWFPLSFLEFETDADREFVVRGIYRSFDGVTPEDRAAMLGRVVHDAILPEVYLESARSLGDPARGIESIRVTDVTMPGPGHWIVEAYVGHWGHLHQRRLGVWGQLDLTFDRLAGHFKLSNALITRVEELPRNRPGANDSK